MSSPRSTSGSTASRAWSSIRARSATSRRAARAAPRRRRRRTPAMPDVLLERVLTQGEQEYARRVTSDGRVWARSTVSATLDDGEWTFTDGDNQWRELAALSPA